MLDDNDVFDSVTWETPSGGGAAFNPPPSGPGFRQSTSDSAEEPRPHDPKWEGYLITSVKDPVKELAETKDAYVSYLVSAKVRTSPQIPPNPSEDRAICVDRPPNILHTEPLLPETLSGLRIPQESPQSRLSRLRRPTSP